MEGCGECASLFYFFRQRRFFAGFVLHRNVLTLCSKWFTRDFAHSQPENPPYNTVQATTGARGRALWSNASVVCAAPSPPPPPPPPPPLPPLVVPVDTHGHE